MRLLYLQGHGTIAGTIAGISPLNLDVKNTRRSYETDGRTDSFVVCMFNVEVYDTVCPSVCLGASPYGQEGYVLLSCTRDNISLANDAVWP